MTEKQTYLWYQGGGLGSLKVGSLGYLGYLGRKDGERGRWGLWGTWGTRGEGNGVGQLLSLGYLVYRGYQRRRAGW